MEGCKTGCRWDGLVRQGVRGRWKMSGTSLIEQKVGPCASARQIQDWIDELLELRSGLGGHYSAVQEINYHLGIALGWLGARHAGLRCA